ANDRAPAAGAEGDQVLLLLAAGTEDPFLENELGVGQIVQSVYTLDLILVVQLIAVNTQAGTDEFVYTGGETVLASARGGRKPAQGEEDGCRIHYISSEVPLANLPDFRQCLVFFDDVQHLTAGIADDTAVRQGAVEHGGQQREVRLLQEVPVDQATNRSWTE